MNLDDLFLNMHNFSFDSLIRQTEIHSEEDKEHYSSQDYNIAMTLPEFTEKFPQVDPSCIWYTPSVSFSSLYFNENTLAAMPCYLELIISGLFMDSNEFCEAIALREKDVQNNVYHSSLLGLPDGLRMEYFQKLVNLNPNCPNLYDLFFSFYQQSDYGFGRLDPSALKVILNSKTPADIQKTQSQLSDLPEIVTIYRGGNSASTPFEQAYSWSLDINTANFFAGRRGTEEGYIVEAEISKNDIIDLFLDSDEQEIIVNPKDVKVLHKTSVRGVDFIAPILPEIAPMYHDYLDKLENLHFAQSSEAHGPEHEARVLLLSLILSHLHNLPVRDRKVLATAAIYHDIQRVNDIDNSSHGRASREYYQTTTHAPDPLVSFLCEYHCLPDEEGYREIHNNRVLSKNRTRSKLLYDLFKDADALDRVRFGFKALDLHQLRSSVSKELSLVARLCLDQVKYPVKTKSMKSSLSTQINSASLRAKVPLNAHIGDGRTHSLNHPENYR